MAAPPASPARSPIRAPVVVAIVGLALTVAVASAVGAPMHDAGSLIAIAMATSAVVGLFGAGVMQALRQRSLLSQIVAVALVSVVVVAAGAVAAAQAMFLSTHDLRALGVVLVGAATVATVMALVLGGQIVRGTALVGSAARRMVDDGTAAASSGRTAATSPTGPPSPPVAAELASLVAELDEIRTSLETSRRRERAMEQSRRELVAWVSHDLRTPLAGLRAMVEALEDGIVSEPAEVTAYHHSMRAEVDRLTALVNDLFELSRIQSGTLTLHPTRVSVADVVSDVLAGSRAGAAAQGVRLVADVPREPTQADVSVPEFQRALHNLVDNAIRHTPADGEVRLRVGVDEGQAVVTVDDECGGIPDDELERVFDVAFSGDSARTPRATVGAGLGLSITRGIVEAHDGAVDVHNDGPGCRFTIRLPLATAP